MLSRVAQLGADGLTSPWALYDGQSLPRRWPHGERAEDWVGNLEKQTCALGGGRGMDVESPHLWGPLEGQG